MTKKDYVLIASVLNTCIKEHNLQQLAVIDRVITSLAYELAKDNPRFNKDTFYDACYKVKP